MADKPATASIKDLTVLGHNIKLAVDDDHLTTCIEISTSNVYPEVRSDYTYDADYNYGIPDIILRATLVVSQDILAYIAGKANPGTTGEHALRSFKITYTSNNGTDETRTFNGYIRETHVERSRTPGQPAEMTLVIRVKAKQEPLS